jgi:hypothetical protein
MGVAAAVLGTPARLAAQDDLAALATAARAQLEELNPDSAAVLLRRALVVGRAAAPTERGAVLVLLGITELFAGRETVAREAFRQALALDPGITVDTLHDLHSELLRVFDAERERLPRLTLEAPLDTQVAAADGRLRLVVRTTRRARVRIIITERAAPATVVHEDTQIVTGATAVEWDLRRADGRGPAPASYTLRVTAQDDAGLTAAPVVRFVAVDSVPPDTQPLPPPLADTALLPESASVRTRNTGALLRGLLFAAGGVFLAVYSGPERPNRDAKALVVGGAIAVGGTVGFLTGRNTTRPIPENVVRNARTRDENARQRRDVEAANARLRESPRLRVRMTGTAT